MQLSPEVIDVLDRCQIEGERLVLPEQLDRKLYVKVNKALEALGGVWSRKEKGHLFGRDAQTIIDDALTSGEVTDERKLYQVFPTPPQVVAEVLEHAGIEREHLVLEPSAGDLRLAVAVANRKGARVECYDIRPITLPTVAAEWGLITVHPEPVDFLTVAPRPEFDRVVMNPPFTGQQDIRHVAHAVRFLKPGGRLVSVMAPSWQHNQRAVAEAFRRAVELLDGEVHVLPAGSFKDSGTMVNTVIVVLNMPEEMPFGLDTTLAVAHG